MVEARLQLRRLGVLTALLAGLTAQAAETAPPAVRVTMNDVTGVERSVVDRASRASVLFFIATDCPISNRYAPEIQRIHRRYAGRGVAFYLVYVEPGLSTEAARQHIREYRLPGRGLIDTKHRLVRVCGASVTPEAAVLDASGKLVYAGRIDDWYVEPGERRAAPTTRDLRQALEATLSGKAPRPARTRAVGCLIPEMK